MPSTLLHSTMPSPPPSPPPPPPSPSISRPILPLPEAALFHSITFLEESLFSQAFTNLTSCLTSGLSTNSPAYIPPPSVLALAATVSVHPSYTTRTADKDRWRDADSAARYLRSAVDVVDGRVKGGWSEAFAFQQAARRKNVRQGRRGRGNSRVDVDENGERTLAGKYANQQSLWSGARDFWAVVGWALNCSVRHKGRWERWKGWVEVMLYVLERDLQRSTTRGMLHECLLHQYMQSIGGGRNDQRRVMRAILADGSEKSVGEFGEVWRDETRGPKVEDDDDDEKMGNKRKLDLENGEYGDYFDEDSAAEESKLSSTRKPQSAHSKPKRGTSAGSSDVSASSSTSTATGDVASFGGYDSLRLRQRLLALLASFSNLAPKLLGADLAEIWSLYTEFLRPLPLPIFQQFISPQKAYLTPAWQASLCEMMSRALLGISGSYGIVTRESFEKDIVRATANNSTVIDNAKVGVLVESLLRLLWMQGFLDQPWEGAREDIEEGIQRREAKANGRKKGPGEEEARERLKMSAGRLRVLGQLICK